MNLKLTSSNRNDTPTAAAPPVIIGISGRKMSGKTTAADGIRAAFSSSLPKPVAVLTRPIADPLKEIIYDLFVPLDFPKQKGIDPEEFRRMEHPSIKSMKLPCGKHLRWLLQHIGTDVCRNIDPDCWIRLWERLLPPASANGRGGNRVYYIVVVPDVRFPNEADTIRSLGGKLIRLLRDPYQLEDTHISETAMEEYPYYDYLLDNTHMSIPEQNKTITHHILAKGWLNAIPYYYQCQNIAPAEWEEE